MPHKVAIIGQSNAILQTGFAWKLAELPEIEIGKKGRLGASPSVILPYFGTTRFFEGHDFCVIDTAVSDQGFLWAGATDPYTIGLWLAVGIQTARAAGCVPILLFIPHKAAVPGPDAPLHVPFLQQLYRAVALHNGAICFDLTERLAILARTDTSAFHAAYRDPDHLSEAFSGEVALRLKRIMDAVAPTIELREQTSQVPAFDRVLAGLGHPQMLRHASSLTKQEVAVLDTNLPQMRVHTGPVTRVHALMLNRPASRGHLVIEGSERIVRELGTPRDNDLPFAAQLCPLLEPLADRDGAVQFTLTDGSTPVTEASWQPVVGGTPRAEISELLVERGSRTLSGGFATVTQSRVHWDP